MKCASDYLNYQRTEFQPSLGLSDKSQVTPLLLDAQ